MPQQTKTEKTSAESVPSASSRDVGDFRRAFSETSEALESSVQELQSAYKRWEASTTDKSEALADLRDFLKEGSTIENRFSYAKQKILSVLGRDAPLLESELSKSKLSKQLSIASKHRKAIRFAISK